MKIKINRLLIVFLIIIVANSIFYISYKKYKNKKNAINNYLNLLNLEHFFESQKSNSYIDINNTFLNNITYLVYNKNGKIINSHNNLKSKINYLRLFKTLNSHINNTTISGDFTYKEAGRQLQIYYKRNVASNKIYIILSNTNVKKSFPYPVLILLSILAFFIFYFFNKLCYKYNFSLTGISAKKRQRSYSYFEEYIANNDYLMSVITDNKGIIKCSSKKLNTVLKYDENFLENKDIRAIFSNKSVNFFERLINFHHFVDDLIDNENKKISVKINVSPITFGKDEMFMIIFEDITEILEKSNKSFEENDKLKNIFELINTLKDYRKIGLIAKEVIEKGSDIVDYNVGTFLIYKNNYLTPIYSNDKTIDNLYLYEMKIALEDGLSGYVAKNKEAAILNNAKKSSITVTVPNTDDEDENLMSIPLISKENLVGVVTFSRKKSHKFKKYDLKLMGLFISQVAEIIANIIEINSLEDSLHRYTTLINNSLLGIFILNDQNIGFVNKTFCNLLGYNNESLIGRNIQDFIYQPDRDKFIMAITSILLNDPISLNKIKFITADQKIITVEIRFSFITWEGKKTIVCSTMDISEKIELTEQIMELQKMESIGLMASSISHDFKNVLSGIIGAAELLDLRTKNSENNSLIKTILQSSYRGKKLSEQILKYSRNSNSEISVFDVNKSVIEITDLVQNTLPKNIKLIRDLAEEKLPFEGDATKIVQCVMNLCVNARDAMEKTGGILEVRTKIISDQSYLNKKARTMIENGKYIEILVKDTGEGISDKVKQKIFEPFFTTKKDGKGTGLGLSTTIKIIKEYNGFIGLESKVGKGTEFYLYLPKSDKKIVEEKNEEILDVKENKVKQIKNILLIDDDQSILEIGKEMIEELGGKVFSYNSAEKALSDLDKLNIDIALVDFDMPKINGEETIKRIIKYNSEIKTYLATGFVDKSRMNELMRNGMTGFLTKPYGISDIREILKN